MHRATHAPLLVRGLVVFHPGRWHHVCTKGGGQMPCIRQDESQPPNLVDNNRVGIQTIQARLSCRSSNIITYIRLVEFVLHDFPD